MLFNLFSMECMEDEETGEPVENDLAASQDYPGHTQSRTRETLKICTCCKFKSRDDSEFEDHMSIHAKCTQCGLFFKDEAALNTHHEAFHAVQVCDQCGKEILKSNLKKHMNSHEIAKGFKKVISRGKVKAKAIPMNEESEPKTVKLTGYRQFMQNKRPLIRDENPDATPQEMVKLLNEAWNNEKLAGNKEIWDKKAKEFGRKETIEVNPFQECSICGLMIAKSTKNIHMERNHGSNSNPPQSDPSIPTAENNIAPAEVISVPAEDISEQNVPEEAVTDATADASLPDIPANPEVVSAPPSFDVGDFVMVMKKTLHWPARVLARNSNIFEVMYYDKARTKEQKQLKYLVPFSTDVSVCEGRGALWVKAWKEAKKDYES